MIQVGNFFLTLLGKNVHRKFGSGNVFLERMESSLNTKRFQNIYRDKVKHYKLYNKYKVFLKRYMVI